MATIKYKDRDVDLRTVGYHDLLDLADELDIALASVNGQIGMAIAEYHATGERADILWFGRVKCARFHLAANKEVVAREIGRRNRNLVEFVYAREDELDDE